MQGNLKPSAASAAAKTHSAATTVLSKMTVMNSRLQRIHRRVSMVTILIPSIGTIIALSLWIHQGQIEPVAISLFFIFFFLNQLGVEVGFHRLFSHSAFTAHPIVRAGLAILGSTAAQGPVINWAATHRRHHPNSDAAADPHSPYIQGEKTFSILHGLYHSHMGWMMGGEITNSAMFTKDLLRDPLINRINRLYFVWVILGLIIPTTIAGLVTDTIQGAFQGFLWGGLVRIFVVHHVTWSSNSICHVYGQRPFETGDYSANNIWLAIPTIGIAWHNNHHAFPNSACHGLEWWQIDLGAWFIRSLERLGLVWDLKVPTVQMKQAKRRKKNHV